MQPLSPTNVGHHAIVIGGSVAGLFAARALSDYFETVTLIERDRISEPRGEHKGVPQARHVHVLLAKGLEIASQLFPDLVASLKSNGAIELDFGAQVRWHHYGGYKAECHGSVNVLSQSRPLLESQIRQRVACLQEHSQDLKGLPQQFFARAARVIDTPWSMALGEDIRFPEVVGNRSLKTSAINWYISKIYQAAHRDSLVNDALIQVMHMMQSPLILFKPALLIRVLRALMPVPFLSPTKMFSHWR
jgi:hypothetical protein